jgi:hypothetical protein
MRGPEPSSSWPISTKPSGRASLTVRALTDLQAQTAPTGTFVAVLTRVLARPAVPRHDQLVDRKQLLRRVFATPAGLYDRRLGWLLGRRFLCLTHRGRKSGNRHQAVLEVLAWSPLAREAVVVSGFGRRSNGFRTRWPVARSRFGSPG